jgi:hypothetical protein
LAGEIWFAGGFILSKWMSDVSALFKGDVSFAAVCLITPLGFDSPWRSRLLKLPAADLASFESDTVTARSKHIQLGVQSAPRCTVWDGVGWSRKVIFAKSAWKTLCPADHMQKYAPPSCRNVNSISESAQAIDFAKSVNNWKTYG